MNPSTLPPAPSDWTRLDAALDQLLGLPASERAARLPALCGGDAALERELRALLDAEQSLGGFMEPAIAAAPAALPSLPESARVGAFRVLRLIGRGGMGEVYLAGRADGEFEQRVALKLLAPALAGKPERFYAERRILAQLEHPGIARLMDGGVTADGRPYMAVEYVEGEELSHWCRQRSPDLAERLQLFMAICVAVAYAHRHLVVHRDLKPANILVSADGQPKLLDFGIATLVDPQRAAAAGLTLHLTPSHAAPEQLQGGAITTATDVYALGVILYELLCGTPPWQLSQLPLATAVARVLDAEPPLPSTRLQGAEARALRGDLDGIVAKALSKAPESRYASAAELLEDLRRHQRHEPVSARGHALRYVASRFIRRHRLAVGSAAAVVLALVAGLAASLWFYVDARRARDHAEAAAATAQAVNDFLNRDLLATADIARRPTRDIGLRELLDKAAAQAGQRFGQQPQAAARVHESLGDSYFNLTAYEPAREQFGKALELQTRLAGRASAPALAVMAKLANVSGYAGRTSEALPLFREAIEGLGRLGQAREVAALRMEYSGLLFTAGQFLESTEQMRRQLEAEARQPTLGVEDRLDLQSRYGGQLAWLGDYPAAEREIREALAGRMSLMGPDQLPTAVSQLTLGSVLVETRRLEEAAAEIEPALAAVRRWVGPEDGFLAMAENTAARLRMEQGRLHEAEQLMSNTLRIRSRVFGAESSFTAWTRTQLAEVLQRQGRLREALALTERALPVAEKIDGPHNPWTTRQRLIQLAILRELGLQARVRTALARITDEAFSGLPPRHPFLGMLRQEQGLMARQEGDLARAKAALTEALSIFEDRYGAQHPRSQRVREQLSALS